jgi:hypothetical protein
VIQHNGLVGNGFRIVNKTYGANVPQPAGYVENAPKDMVTALPSQVTRIKATFDKPGRYVWHCHILSHEDHEMMRILYVGDWRNDPATAVIGVKSDVKIGKAALASAELNAPVTFEMAQNYPNPFNPTTTIGFSLPSDAKVRLDVYSTTGRLVRNLVNESYGAGYHSVKWDGRNNGGSNVASGMYIYKIQAGKYTKTMKMHLLR